MSKTNISIYKVLKESDKENQYISSKSKLSDTQALNISSIKSKRVPVKVDYQSQIDTELNKFSDIKDLAENFIVVAASRNKTGTISESRKLSLLCQLSAVLTATGDKGIFKDALLEVIAKGVDNINYLKKVVETKGQKKNRKEVSDDARFSFQKRNCKAGGGVSETVVGSGHT